MDEALRDKLDGRRVVDWSRTSYGGRQLELFAPPNEGCMRWGLCDHGEPEDEPEEPTLYAILAKERD